MAKQRTEEEKEQILEHCLELERTGGDILGYLWSQNYLTPRATWFNYQREWLGRKPYQYTDGKPRKGENDMKLTLENKKRAVEIAVSGESPLGYLKSLGIKNPSASWNMIKKGLQKADPEMFLKLPKDLRKVEKPALVAKVDGPVVMETPNDGQIEIAPKKENVFEITGVRDKNLGEFHFDRDRNSLEWRTGAGEEVLMSVDGWRMLADRLPEIMKTLGVSA